MSPEDLARFGGPLYVPASDAWRVVGVEHSGGVPDGVVVFSEDNDLEVRTESASRPPQPLSVRVSNVQAATPPLQGLDDSWRRVIVDEEVVTLEVDGEATIVRALCSYNSFSVQLSLGGRTVSVAGRLPKLTGLGLTRVDDVRGIPVVGT